MVGVSREREKKELQAATYNKGEWQLLRAKVDRILRASRHTRNGWLDQMKKGAEELQSVVQQADYSLIPFLIQVGMQYYRGLLSQWRVYKRDFTQLVSNYVSTVQAKITDLQAPIQHTTSPRFLEAEFRPFKELFEKSTKLKVDMLRSNKAKASKVQEEQKQNIIQYRKDISLLGKIGGEGTKETKGVLINPYQNLEGTVVSVLKEFYQKIKLHAIPASVEDKRLGRRIQERTISHSDCLGCASFFYQNQDISMPVPRQPVSYFKNLKYLFDEPRFRDAFLRNLVGFLNSEGGVILMGCEKVQKGVIPATEITEEAHKDSWQDKIQSFLKDVHPHANVSNYYSVGYVPVCEPPTPDMIEPQWLRGVYVMRIVVYPVEPNQTYFFDRDRICFPVHVKAKPPSSHPERTLEYQAEQNLVELTEQNIYNFMVRKYYRYTPQNNRIDSKLTKIGNCYPALIEHIDACERPLTGQPEYGDHKRKRRIPEGGLMLENKLKRGREQFKNVSLVICRSNLIQKIQDRLQLTDKVTTHIEWAWKDQNFKLSNNTFLCWHHVKFDKLSSLIRKEKSLTEANDRRPILLISTANTVRVIDRQLTTKEKDQASNRLFQLTGDKVVIKTWKGYTYIQCSQNINAVYLYFFITHHFEVKTVFEKMPEKEEDVRDKYTRKQNAHSKKEQQHQQRQQKKVQKQPQPKYQSESYLPELQQQELVPVINQSMPVINQWQDNTGYYVFQFQNGYILRRDYMGVVNFYYNSQWQPVDLYGRLLDY